MVYALPVAGLTAHGQCKMGMRLESLPLESMTMRAWSLWLLRTKLRHQQKSQAQFHSEYSLAGVEHVPTANVPQAEQQGRPNHASESTIKDPARSTLEHGRWRCLRHARIGLPRRPRVARILSARAGSDLAASLVGAPPVTLIIPECPQRPFWLQRTQSIRPALS